jgi:hypothetical protein
MDDPATTITDTTIDILHKDGAMIYLFGKGPKIKKFFKIQLHIAWKRRVGDKTSSTEYYRMQTCPYLFWLLGV